jgi:transcriptional regulator of acetoin/glycerol metabolism|tara:strand:- start:178 stop:456 length:279 start_codon:yes stop_codon:yes gene_type:complete
LEDLPVEVGHPSFKTSENLNSKSLELNSLDKNTINNSTSNFNFESNDDKLLTLNLANKLALISSLRLCNNDFSNAAKKLGVSRTAFYRKAKK